MIGKWRRHHALKGMVNTWCYIRRLFQWRKPKLSNLISISNYFRHRSWAEVVMEAWSYLILEAMHQWEYLKSIQGKCSAVSGTTSTKERFWVLLMTDQSSFGTLTHPQVKKPSSMISLFTKQCGIQLMKVYSAHVVETRVQEFGI